MDAELSDAESRYVATPEAVAVIEGLVGSSMPDLQRLRRGMWALPITAETTGLLFVDHWKGGALSLSHGVCCSWVPFRHRGGQKIEWPVTVRQSVPHLWIDHFADDHKPRYVSQLHGRERLEGEALGAVAEAEQRARAWWASAASPDDVLVEAERQAARSVNIHWPSPGLVAAFTLARLGKPEAARQELDRILARWDDEGGAAEQTRLFIRLLDEVPKPA